MGFKNLYVKEAKQKNKKHITDSLTTANSFSNKIEAVRSVFKDLTG